MIGLYETVLVIFYVFLQKLKLFTLSSEKMKVLFVSNHAHELDNSCSPGMIYLMIENSSLGISVNYFFEVNLDLHAVVRDNKQRSHIPFFKFLLMVEA